MKMTDQSSPGQGSKETLTGVQIIDVNRECLLFLTERYFDPLVICGERGEVCKRLEDTLRFLKRNFAREEYIIRASGYSCLDEHVKDHQRLIAYLEKMKATHKCSEYDNDEVVDFISAWLSRHSKEFDHDFASYWIERRNNAHNR